METREIMLTLEQAKEMYNSGNDALKAVALQAFTEEELTLPAWQNIKTFADARKALGVERTFLNLVIEGLNGISYFNHLKAVLKLDIIHKALNGDWQPKMNEGDIHFPCVSYYPAGDKAKEAARCNGLTVRETFKTDGKKYQLVGGHSLTFCRGLGDFICGSGSANPVPGLLACKSEEIAQHMSRYFAKEIFEACYAQYVGTYTWVEDE